jgi:serine phosphatase RsbU (regulator of sigma subunit)
MVVLALVVLSFAIYTIKQRRITKMQALQERIESELRVARDIQMSMVPSIFPEHDRLDMFASMTPAKEVGGDLYGYLLTGDQLYFAIGDVSGKGVPASLFMAQATRLFLTMAKQGMMPAEICTRMNDALSGNDNENGMFVTFWIGLADLQTGHLYFCNAGHNPPVIGNGDHNCEFLEMEANAPIGLFPGLDYEGEEIDSIKNQQLFIYTDGLNEAEDPQQEQFGDDRLIDIIRNTQHDSARQTIDTVRAAVEAHRKGAEPNDDLTMMCVRII